MGRCTAKSLNGGNTRSLTEHALGVLHEIIQHPRPRASINHGVADRLTRQPEPLCDEVQLPSPYKKDKGGMCRFLRVTTAGRHHVMGLRFYAAVDVFVGCMMSPQLYDALLSMLYGAANTLLNTGIVGAAHKVGFEIEDAGIRVTFWYRPVWPFDNEVTSWFFPYKEQRCVTTS